MATDQDDADPDPGKAELPGRSRSDAASVAALRRGLSVLDAFSEDKELGVNELARKVGVHKSTVSRLCATLESGGYLQRDEVTGRFRLGARIFQLAGARQIDADLRTAARPVIIDLCAAAGETVSLLVVAGTEIITIDQVEGANFVRMQTRLGMRSFVGSSAAAKAIVAAMPPEEREKMLTDWPGTKMTPNTITDVAAYQAELDEVRSRGYARDMEELEIGLRCVGAAIRDQTGAVVAGISVSGPRHRMTDEVMTVIGRLTTRSAEMISTRLGAPPRV